MKYVAIVTMLAASGMAVAQTPPPADPAMGDMDMEMQHGMTPSDDAMEGHMQNGMMDEDMKEHMQDHMNQSHPAGTPTPMPGMNQPQAHNPTAPHTAPPAHGTTPSGNPIPAPGQMAHPSPAGQAPVAAQRLDTYRPQPRAEYPRCSRTVTDNCVQRNDPGGN